jgi:hypothetical protein
MHLSEAYNNCRDYTVTHGSKLWIEKAPPLYCSFCHDALYGLENIPLYRQRVRALFSSLGFILICGSCYSRYSSDYLRSKIGAQGWATMSTDNVKVAKRYLIGQGTLREEDLQIGTML